MPSATSLSLHAALRSVHRQTLVTFWGALAMAITAGVGTLFGTVV